jgi:hypothetical protein
LLWAVGYNAEESYYFDHVNVDGLKKLSRGQQYVSGQSVRGARFEPRRKDVERGKAVGLVKKPVQGHARVERSEDDDGAVE